MDAEQVAAKIGATLNEAGFDGLEQAVHDSEDHFQLFLEVAGEWFTVAVTKDAL